MDGDFGNRAIPTLHGSITTLPVFNPRQYAIVMQVIVFDFVMVLEDWSQHTPLVSPKLIDHILVPSFHAIEWLAWITPAAQLIIPRPRGLVRSNKWQVRIINAFFEKVKYEFSVSQVN
jgi:hypothetical protein